MLKKKNTWKCSKENKKTDLDKLRLYGSRVNALVVEEMFHLLGNAHVVANIEATYMCWRYDAITGQLPHMKLMNG